MRKHSGQILRSAQPSTAATTTKFRTHAQPVRMLPSSSPVSFDTNCTDADCLNCPFVALRRLLRAILWRVLRASRTIRTLSSLAGLGCIACPRRLCRSRLSQERCRGSRRTSSQTHRRVARKNTPSARPDQFVSLAFIALPAGRRARWAQHTADNFSRQLAALRLQTSWA